MYSLQQIKVNHVLQDPEGYVISARHEVFGREFQFIIDGMGRVYGRTGGNQWVELSPETRKLVRDKIFEYFEQTDALCSVR